MKEELINYGLSEKEAKIYLICLKLGESTANKIIEISGLARGTTYDVLEKLKLRGLVSSFVKKKTTLFRANDPDILVKALDQKKIDIKEIIPNLKKIKGNITSDNLVEIFEGKVGVKKVLDDAIKDCKFVIVMGNEEKSEEILSHYSDNFKLKRLEKKIKIKNLLENSETSKKLIDDKYSTVRFLRDLKDYNSFKVIYNDIVINIILEEPITTIRIHSKEHASFEKMLFEKVWSLAKR